MTDGAVSQPRDGLRAREAQRLALFAPVLFGLGIWLYFAAPVEPTRDAVLAMVLAAVLAAAGALVFRRARLLRVGCLAAMMAAAGFAVAGERTERVAAPVLPSELANRTVEIEGVVTVVGRSGSGRARLLIDHPRIAGASPEQTPQRIRVTLSRPPDDAARALLWRSVRLSAHLSAPFSPVEPGAYDARFDAWFDRIGAIGVARSAVEDLGAAPRETAFEVLRAAVSHARARVAAAARSALGGDTGALAAALLVGDRSALDQSVIEDLRRANLSHLLAISGLHMGLVCLTVFGALRLGFALSETAAGRREPKKVAAIGAILAGAVYLALSGGAIASWRAFAMAAVAFGAVLADRSPVTLRAVALAALLILAAAPESLFDIGFQLSFAATTAMVAVFEWTRPVWRSRRVAAEEATYPLLRTIGLWALALVVSSLVAGLATAPFAAAAFNRSAPYGLLANLLAMPIMGFWIMPFGVLALILAPLGLASLALVPMGYGLDQVIAVAGWVAALPGAEQLVPAPAAPVTAMLALGGLWLCLWRSSWLRMSAATPLGAALILWAFASPRPDLLIGPGGALVGANTGKGRVLDRESGEGFVALRWLRADADPAEQAQSAARGFWREERGGQSGRLGDVTVRVVLWKTLGERDLQRLCAGPTLIVAPRAEWANAQDPSPAGRRAARLALAPADAASLGSPDFALSVQRIAEALGWPPGRRAKSEPVTLSTAVSQPDCFVLDAATLSETGAIAGNLSNAEGALALTSVARRSGRRYWTDAALRERDQ